MKFCFWLVGLCFILVFNEAAIHMILPEVQVDAAMRQMDGAALSSSGFTYADRARQLFVPVSCLVWTCIMYLGDIVSMFKKGESK